MATTIAASPARRRKANGHVPTEVHWPGSPPKRSRLLRSDNDPRSSRVRILAGDDNRKASPSEPRDDPPRLERLLPIAVIGSKQAGKDALIRSYVDREHVNEDEESSPMAAATSRNSVVAYFKKDVTFQQQGETCATRVQFYKLQAVDPAAEVASDRQQEQIESVLDKAWHIMLVVSLRQQDPLQHARQLKQWLDQQFLHNCEDLPSISLVLTQADQLPDDLRPLDWLRFGAALADTCRELCIDLSFMTSAAPNDVHDFETMDNVMNSIARHVFAAREQNITSAVGGASSLAGALMSTPDKKDAMSTITTVTPSTATTEVTRN